MPWGQAALQPSQGPPLDSSSGPVWNTGSRLDSAASKGSCCTCSGSPSASGRSLRLVWKQALQPRPGAAPCTPLAHQRSARTGRASWRGHHVSMHARRLAPLWQAAGRPARACADGATARLVREVRFCHATFAAQRLLRQSAAPGQQLSQHVQNLSLRCRPLQDPEV